MQVPPVKDRARQLEDALRGVKSALSDSFPHVPREIRRQLDGLMGKSIYEATDWLSSTPAFVYRDTLRDRLQSLRVCLGKCLLVGDAPTAQLVAPILNGAHPDLVPAADDAMNPSEWKRALMAGAGLKGTLLAVESRLKLLRSEIAGGEGADETPEQIPPPNAQERAPSSINNLQAARRVAAYVDSSPLSRTQFATKAQTTDKTLRKFLTTGKVRRSTFIEIATAMNVSPEDLLKPDPEQGD